MSSNGSDELASVQALIADAEENYSDNIPTGKEHSAEVVTNLGPILLATTPSVRSSQLASAIILNIASGRSNNHALSPDTFPSNEISAACFELLTVLKNNITELYQRLVATGDVITSQNKTIWDIALNLNGDPISAPSRAFHCHKLDSITSLVESLRNLESHGETLRPLMSKLLKIVRSLHRCEALDESPTRADSIIFIENNARHIDRSQQIKVITNVNPTIRIIDKTLEDDEMNDLDTGISRCLTLLFIDSSLTAIFRAILTSRIAYLTALESYTTSLEKIKGINPSTKLANLYDQIVVLGTVPTDEYRTIFSHHNQNIVHARNNLLEHTMSLRTLDAEHLATSGIILDKYLFSSSNYADFSI